MFYSTITLKGYIPIIRNNKGEKSFMEPKNLEFKITFKGSKKDIAWLENFNFFENSAFKYEGFSIKEWLDVTFKGTILISHSDPELELFDTMEKRGLIQLQKLDEISLACFAELVSDLTSIAVKGATQGEITVASVECISNGTESSIYTN